MSLIKIKDVGNFRVRKGTMILDLFIDKEIPITATCGGRGRCGSCKTRIIGKVRKPDEIEKLFIPAHQLRLGYRLACRYSIDDDIELMIPKQRKEKRPVETGYGLAMDLGTTVIKAAMVDLKKGEVKRKVSVYNPQNSIGGDVIIRIGYAVGRGYVISRRLLFSGIDLAGERLGLQNPAFTTVVGNSVMLSFFLNKPVDGLAGYPFTPAIKKGLFLKKPPCYVFPVIGGFVGGDTIAGILASGVLDEPGYSLYVDLGTNGEVVLVKKHKIIATSTAAGPAFEGIGISCGSLAVPGAIDRIWYRKGLRYRTIERKKPVGICASGLIDVLATLLDLGWLKEDGRLLMDVRIGGIGISQDDIRMLQLAIGAIHTGIRILLEKNRVRPSAINGVVLTGEFGSNLNPQSLERVGILPKGVKKIRFESDLPLLGAVKVLTDNSSIDEVAMIESKAVHLELAMQSQFQEKFTSAMRLAPWP